MIQQPSQVPLGVGYYSRAQAARLLKLTPSRVTRWVRGYTYWLETGDEPVKRRKSSVIATDLPQVDGAFALSFLELIELRILRVLVEDRGIPLQTVRKAARKARSQFGAGHPFASRKVFTHRREIFAEIDHQLGADVAGLLELTNTQDLQIHSAQLLSPYLEEIDFNETTALAERWWPLGRDVPVVLDPALEFGAPVIYPTRIRTDVVAGLAAVESIPAVCDSYRIKPAQARAAIGFEEALAAA